MKLETGDSQDLKYRVYRIMRGGRPIQLRVAENGERSHSDGSGSRSSCSCSSRSRSTPLRNARSGSAVVAVLLMLLYLLSVVLSPFLRQASVHVRLSRGSSRICGFVCLLLIVLLRLGWWCCVWESGLGDCEVCVPLLELIQVRATWPWMTCMETMSAQVDGVAQVAGWCVDATDLKHQTSMREVSEKTTKLWQDYESSKRFSGVSVSAATASTAAAFSLRSVGGFHPGGGQDIEEEVTRTRDLLNVDLQKQFDLIACEEEQGNFDKKTVLNYCFMSTVPKEERFRRMITARMVPESKALNIKTREIRVRIELSARRRVLLKAQARFMALTERQGAPTRALNLIWRHTGLSGFRWLRPPCGCSVYD